MSEQADSNAVAIVGMGALFPGAGSAPEFWRNIAAGTDAITDVPPDRWDPAVYCDPEQAGAGAFYTRRGGFLGAEATFNPHPFGLMLSSVDGTEPDQLLMLRAAAEAIGDGAALPDRDRVGVIVGRGGYLTPGLARMDQRVSAPHQLMAVLSDLLPELNAEQRAAVRAAFEERLGRDDPQDSIGLVPNFAASRLANRFDLHGPAYTVDAACASSLLAVDHAVRELLSGRCDAVLAGGVHTCHHPALWSVFTRLRVLSPGGVIRPFDAAADGTLLSEGAGAVLLKRLADAQASGDRIYAVIRGVGVSSDGRATSMLNPLVEGQELAIRRAWAAAGLDPAAPGSLGLLEAHGTATPTGDRAELTAINRVFGPPTGGPAGGRPIGIGSVKSMIGHAMPAAGIAGLIKAAFAVHEGVLPPTLHVDEPNPALAGTRFAPVTRTEGWEDGPLRRAAVSAFGFGGINAHVILESPRGPSWARLRPARIPSDVPEVGTSRPRGGEGILRLSADSPAELARLLDVPDTVLFELAAEGTASTSPGAPSRLAIVAPDERRLVLARKIIERGSPWRGRSDIWFAPHPLLHGPEQVAFLYPGFEPQFAPRAEGVAEAFGLPPLQLGGTGASIAGRSPGLTSDGGAGAMAHALDILAVSRLFSAALGQLGISAGALAGHSFGEWTAMVAAGMYPETDEFIALLEPGIVELPDVGYLALGASAARAEELIRGLDDVVVTHDNCPRQSMICGPSAPVARAARRAWEAGILAQPMPFRTGFHSPAYAPHMPPVRQALDGLAIRPPQVPVWSATTLMPFPGDPREVKELVLRHLVEPVRFRPLTELLHDTGFRAFVQVGPGSLTSFIDDTLGGRDYLTVATATPKRDGLAQLRRVAAALWAEGLEPRFERFDQVAADQAGLNQAGLGQAGSGRAGTAADSPEVSVAAAPAPVSAAAPGAGGVPLRLGGSIVRLAGVLEPLSVGGPARPAAGPDLAPALASSADPGAVPNLAQPGPGRLGSDVPVGGWFASRTPAGGQAVAELGALLAETSAAAETVVAALAQPALAQPPVPAPPVPASPAPAPPIPAPRATASPAFTSPVPVGEAGDEREFSLRTMPHVADHCLLRQPEGWPEDSDRFPIVPLTSMLEIMSDAALGLLPGRVVTGLQQVKAMRWLAVAPPTRTAVRASLVDTFNGTARVRVAIEGYASGYVLLSDRYPAAPWPDHTPLHDRRTPPVSARELYADRWMFHGPKFAGVADIAALAADGIVGTVLSLPAQGALLDSVGQIIGHWMQVMPTDGQTVLPTGIAAVRFYGPQPAAGHPLTCVARIRELTSTEMRADAEITDDTGRVWGQIEDWTTQRFATDDAILQTRRWPGRSGLSWRAEDGWNVAVERWPDTASRELIMRLYLNAAERADYERLPPLRQRRWLLGRIAVKDAVRRSLWDRGAGEVFPVELTVTETTGPESTGGVQVAGPFRAVPVSLALSPDRPGRPCAVAVTGDHPGLAIEPGPDGTVLVTKTGQPGPVRLTPPPGTGGTSDQQPAVATNLTEALKGR